MAGTLITSGKVAEGDAREDLKQGCERFLCPEKELEFYFFIGIEESRKMSRQGMVCSVRMGLDVQRRVDGGG